jgi:SnoaL-like domain
MRTSLWLAFALTFVVAASAPAQQAAVPADASVAALLQKRDEAMNQKNLDAVMALFAPGDTTVMIGTGPGERWVGKDMAWGAAMCTMGDTLKDRKRSYDLNVSAVAAKRGGQWLFRSLHFSNLTGPLQSRPAN